MYWRRGRTTEVNVSVDPPVLVASQVYHFITFKVIILLILLFYLYGTKLSSEKNTFLILSIFTFFELVFFLIKVECEKF